MKFQTTLRTRLVMLVMAAIVPLFGLSIFRAVLYSDAAMNRATGQLQVTASLVAANQARVADSAHQLLMSIASMPGLADGSAQDCRRYFKSLTAQFPMYTNLGIFGLDGHSRCHSWADGQEVFAGDRDYFQKALAGRAFTVSPYLRGRAAGKPIITFAMPVLTAEGKVTGVAFASVDMQVISKAVAETPLPQGSRLMIMDRRGSILVTNPEQPERVGQQVGNRLLLAALATMGSGVREGPDKQGIPRIYAFLPSGKPADAPFFVAVSADKEGVIAPSRKQLAWELAVLALVAFLGGWLAWVVGGRAIVKPATEILEAARQVQDGLLDVRIPLRSLGGGSEFARIAEGFNRMTDALQQRQRDLDLELEKSRQANSTLELTMNSMQEGLVAVDAIGRFLLVNESAKRLLSIADNTTVLTPQWSREQGLFVPGTETLLAIDEVPLFRALRGESGGPTPILLRNSKQPQGRLLNCSYRPMFDGDDIVGALVVFADITEVDRLRQAQALSYAQLREIQRRLLDAQRLGRIGTWELDVRTRALWVSDEIYDLYDVNREAFDGKPEGLLELVHPEDLARYLQQRNDAVQVGLPTNIEYRIITKAGETRWMHQFDRLQTDVEGRALYRTGVVQEITERKRAEQALVDSEQRYATLFETAPVAMWLFDTTNWHFLMVNQTAVQNYGYSANEFLAMTAFDIRPESEHAGFRKEMAGTLPGTKGIWTHRRKDGSLFPMEIFSQPTQYAGRAARFVVALDVTAQVKAEKDVQEHLFTLQRAADAAQAITWHQTLDGMLQEVADQARGVIGAHQAVVSLSEGGHWAQAIHALSLSEKYAAYRDLIATPDGSGIYALVCENNRAMRMTQAELEAHPRWKGFGRHAEKHPTMRGWLAVPLVGRSGNNIGLLQLSDKYEGEFTPQDQYVALEFAQLASSAIENARLLNEVGQLNAGLEQKVAQRTVALARQEALFRALAEQAPEVVWTSTPDGGATYFNRAWFELVGGELQDWTGAQWFSAIHPEDLPSVQASWQSARANRSQYVGIRRVLDKDGNYHTMSYRASPVLDDQGEVAFWVGIDADITEIKAIEAALRLSNQELEAFSYSVSHDLRSPLNTIDGFSRLLAKQLGSHEDIGEKVPHYLSRIQAGVAQMGQLIEGLLSLAQVSRMQLLHEPVDLSALAHGILEEWRARHPERLLTLQIESGLRVRGDGRLVRVVMENLLSNACKFTAQQARAELRVGRKLDAAGLPVFFVSDNGAGFDMAYADKLFNPFQRLHAVSEYPGMGIGLATVSRVIRRHGGRLWAEAAPGKGATFFFTLPKGGAGV